jgi:PAS domain S-box-containing protein
MTTVASPLDSIDLWLLDSLVVPASLHDVEGRFVHMNAAAEPASGRSNAYFRGRHFTHPLPADARPRVEAHFRHAVEDGEPTDFETPFYDADGTLRWARAQHLPLRDGDEIVGVLILAFDVRQPAGGPVDLKAMPQLTPRQREILELLATGSSTADIARQLTLSTETVRNHLRRVFHELQVHNRVEAIVVAQRLGLLAPPPLGPRH